jgi:serine/threonine protein kinase/ribosomal protein L34
LNLPEVRKMSKQMENEDFDRTIRQNEEDKTVRDDKTVRTGNDSGTETQNFRRKNSNVLITTFRGYNIQKEFPARGAEADAFLLEKNGQLYFLKLYRKGINPKLEVLEKIKSISENLKEHVIQIYEVGYDEELQRYYEIMEYARFGSMKELIERLEKFSFKEREELVISAVVELVEGINALHKAGIVHRDLKPANILIRSFQPMDLVLTDFGISLMLSDDVSKIYASSFKGTPAYIAPEEISNYFGKEIDWWHLGVVVYEMLLGKNPFTGLSEQVIIHRLVTKGIEIPESIEPKFKLLLKGLLTRDRSKRWGYEQIKAWLKGEKNIPVYYDYESKPFEEDTNETDMREWLRMGFTKRSAKLWSELGLSPKEAQEYKEYFSYSEAKPWALVGFKSGKIARKWFESGFEPEEAKVFEDIGINPKDALKLKDKGITAYELKEAFENGNIDPETFNVQKAIECQIKGFRLSEFSPDEADAWMKMGFSPSEAKYWKKSGFKPSDASKWISKGFNKADKASEWKSHGFDADEAAKWASIFLSPAEALEWKSKGFTYLEANLWSSLGFKVVEAKEWKEAGFDPYESKKWKDFGFGVEKAWKWKKVVHEPSEAIEWIDKMFTPSQVRRWKEAGFRAEEADKLLNAGIECDKAKELRLKGSDLNRIIEKNMNSLEKFLNNVYKTILPVLVGVLHILTFFPILNFILMQQGQNDVLSNNAVLPLAILIVVGLLGAFVGKRFKQHKNFYTILLLTIYSAFLLLNVSLFLVLSKIDTSVVIAGLFLYPIVAVSLTKLWSKEKPNGVEKNNALIRWLIVYLVLFTLVVATGYGLVSMVLNDNSVEIFKSSFVAFLFFRLFVYLTYIFICANFVSFIVKVLSDEK